MQLHPLPLPYDECIPSRASGGQMVCYYAVNDFGRVDESFVSVS